MLLLFVFIPFPDVWITPFLLSPNPYGALLNPLAKYPNRTLFVPLFSHRAIWNLIEKSELNIFGSPDPYSTLSIPAALFRSALK